MKKLDKNRYKRLQQKRERKRVKRLRVIRRRKNALNKLAQKLISAEIRHETKVFENREIKINCFLNDFSYENKNYFSSDIYINKKFSLEFNYKETLEVLDKVRLSIYNSRGKDVFLNFSKCTEVDFAALFMLTVVVYEYLFSLKNFDKKFKHTSVLPKIRVVPSKKDSVNSKLLAVSFIPTTTVSEDGYVPLSQLGLTVGSKAQKHYAENKKGYAVSTVRDYINKECLFPHKVELSQSGVGFIDRLVGEVLNNAEDHSPFNTWYINANHFQTDSTTKTSEVNIGIFNFGYSIYDGFVNTKDKNSNIFHAMQKHATKVLKLDKYHSEENLMTLYALQEGVSRLKFQNKDRGTGTMTFLRAFLDLGDFEKRSRNLVPRLLLFSGNTKLRYDNKFKPYLKNDKHYLSLNEQNSLSLPPEKSHLGKLNVKFPGTFIVAKIYLDTRHLQSKLLKDATPS